MTFSSLSLAAFALAACAAGPAGADRAMARNVIEAVNVMRADQGLPPLTADAALDAAALAHAADQARAARMTHEGTDGSALDDRLLRAGYDYARAKEAVAVGWDGAQGVTGGWWASPSHRDALLHHPASEVGAGVVRGADGRAYWTLIVAEPRS